MQFAVATGAGFAVDVDDDLYSRQMRWQRSAIGATLASPRRAVLACTLVLLCFARRFDLLDVFQAQQHLLLGQRLRPAAKAMALHFPDDLTQPLALAPLGKQHRFQHLKIIRQCVARHEQIRSYSAELCDDPDAPDSLRRRATNNYPGCVGVAVSRASWTRRQSSPSSEGVWRCP
jgi:hypothetical protein